MLVIVSKASRLVTLAPEGLILVAASSNDSPEDGLFGNLSLVDVYVRCSQRIIDPMARYLGMKYVFLALNITFASSNRPRPKLDYWKIIL